MLALNEEEPEEEMHTKKQIFDIFSERLKQNFTGYCEKFEQQEDLHNFITYLIDHELVPLHTVQRYTLIEEYNRLYERNDKQKTKTVHDLAMKYNVSARTIWNLLRKEKHRIIK